jgi:hypothetical protein
MENTMQYTDTILVFKIIHGLAPPPLQKYIKRNTYSTTRSGSRGHCTVPCRRSAFGQAFFSYRATNTWNSIPSAIHKLPTLTSFSKHLKKMASGKSNMWSLAGIIYNLSTAADLLTLSIMCIMMFYSVCVSVYYVLFYFFYLFRDHLPVRD